MWLRTWLPDSGDLGSSPGQLTLKSLHDLEGMWLWASASLSVKGSENEQPGPRSPCHTCSRINIHTMALVQASRKPWSPWLGIHSKNTADRPAFS